MCLEVVLALVGWCSKDFYLIEIALTHSRLGKGFEIHNLGWVESHQLCREGVHCERVEACQGELCIDGCSAGRAVAFHSYEAVNDAEVGINFLGEVKHVVMQEGLAGEIVVRVGETLVVCLVVVQRRAEQDVFEGQGCNNAVVGLHFGRGDYV